MKFSDDRISHLARLVEEGLLKSGLVSTPDHDRTSREIKKLMIEFFKVEEGADQDARGKIAGLKRQVAEGSREWEILYRQYFDEAMLRRGR